MSHKAEYQGQQRKITLSECKKRYAAKIKLAYELGKAFYHSEIFQGMQTNFETSWDEYISGMKRKGFEIVDDTKAQVIKLCVEHLSLEELKEVEIFIEYLKNGGLEELKFERQEVINNQLPTICATCQGEGGRRVGMTCSVCGKVREK